MPHFPSMCVGAMVSGSAFLMIDKQLSYRERLSSKWLLREKAEEEILTLWKNARASIGTQSQAPEPPQVAKYMDDAVSSWNSGVETVRDILSK
eukprot:CAMPEP_0197744098 /NCGR_PEP_ID=MMETSP1435-20131217/37519_1 /TAXON_ID=426625 /ORGANISM="Chaetoceros brevis, Strain CCMP164" /LENGTH=92 /DNA_ID=CAMNT_0043335319 /DNA_START=62 /DNA_END=340 /DNA_ORIENTATION=-